MVASVCVAGGDKGGVLIWDVDRNCLLYDIEAHNGKVRAAPGHLGACMHVPSAVRAVQCEQCQGRQEARHNDSNGKDRNLSVCMGSAVC